MPGFALLDVVTRPFPHVAQSGFLPEDVCRRLRDTFPACPPRTDAANYALYPDDPAYAALLAAEPAWKSLYDTFHSQAFVDWALAQFPRQFAGSRVPPGGVRYVDYVEPRAQKDTYAGTDAARVLARDDVFVRMDLHQGKVGYQLPVHVDRARRLLSLLLYLNDSTEIGMHGGVLQLHGPQRRRPPVSVVPAVNLMVAFPCTRDSFHSVSPITAATGPRNYLQVRISSPVDVWSRRVSRERLSRAFAGSRVEAQARPRSARV